MPSPLKSFLTPALEPEEEPELLDELDDTPDEEPEEEPELLDELDDTPEEEPVPLEELDDELLELDALLELEEELEELLDVMVQFALLTSSK